MTSCPISEPFPGPLFQPNLAPCQPSAEREGREDLRRRVLAPGDVNLSDAEAISLLSGIGEAEAQQLLHHFGSLPEVLGAPAADLVREGGRRAAVALRLVQLLARRQLERPLRSREVITSSTQLHAYLRATLTGLPREQFRVLFLDRRNRLIADELMAEGTVDHAPVYPREVMRRALERHASAVVLVHNHPSGDPNPSSADVEMTRQVMEAARGLRIGVHDHILVAGAEAVSFRALGLM